MEDLVDRLRARDEHEAADEIVELRHDRDGWKRIAADQLDTLCAMDTALTDYHQSLQEIARRKRTD